MASSQRESLLSRPVSLVSGRMVEMLLNESHLVDFLQGSNPVANLGEAAFAQGDHAFFASDALDLRGGPAVDDHFADAVGQVEQLADGGAAVEAGTGAFEATAALNQSYPGPCGGVETGFRQFFRGVFFRAFAILADHANQTLGHDAVQRGHKIVGLDAHVDKAADYVGDVVGVNSGKDQMAGERGLNGNLSGFLVANFADHDLVGIVAQDGTQAAREGQTLFFVDGNLRDASKLVLDGIFNGDDLVFVGFDFIYGGVQSGGLAGAGWSGNQHHAVGLADVTTEATGFFGGETDYVEVEALKFFRKSFLVQHAQHGIFAVACGHDGDAQIDEATFVFHAETAVLGNAALGDVQIAEDFNARKDGGMPFLGDRLHGVLQNAVDAVLYGNFRVTGFNVNVTGAALERGKDDGFDETDDRADGGIAAGEAVTGNSLFAFFFFLGHLQSE